MFVSFAPEDIKKYLLTKELPTTLELNLKPPCLFIMIKKKLSLHVAQ